MTGDCPSWLLGLVAFLALALLMPLLLRLPWRPSNPTLVLCITGGIVYAVAFALSAVIVKHLDFWAFSISYTFLFLTFLQFFGLVYKSISLRFLHDLANWPGRTMTGAEFFERVVVDGTYRRRLEALAKAGVWTLEAGEVRITAQAARTAHTLRLIQHLLGIKESG